MSLHKPFDTFGFDAGLLDVELLREGVFRLKLENNPSFEGWTFSKQHVGKEVIFRADPPDAEKYPSLAIKEFDDAVEVRREFDVLDALYDFGFAIGPRPFHILDDLLIMEWLHGDSLQQPPSPNEEDHWHRIMALLGVSWSLPFAKFSSKIAMHGTAPQSPADMFRWLDAELAKLDVNHPDYEILARMIESVKERVSPNWDPPSIVTLNHLDPQPHHFIWDGSHMRLVGWNNADWADKAFAVGQLCAHPAYQEVPANHWVWYRWELARLNKDQSLKGRSTTYTHMLYVYWTVSMTVKIAALDQEDAFKNKKLQTQRKQYLQKALRIFS